VYGSLDILPPVLMTDKGRLLRGKGQNCFINLSHLGRNQIREAIQAEIHPDGTVTGLRQGSYSGQYAVDFRRQYGAAKDSLDFVKQMESTENIHITKLQMSSLNNFSGRVKTDVEFEKRGTVNDSFIYINPLLFARISKSPFTQSERQLPIEMPYAEQENTSVQLTIPEGYRVEELPKSINIMTEDHQGSCRYFIVQQGNKVLLTFGFKFDNLFYAASQYSSVKRFWELVAEKDNELLVLKKL
jgi:hypothetical protein